MLGAVPYHMRGDFWMLRTKGAPVKRTLYEIIGVPPCADTDEIKQAYWAKARELHPDTGTGNTGKFTKLANAWAILEHADTRKKYDKRLHVTYAECPKCKGSGVKYSARNLRSTCTTCNGVGYAER